MPSSYDNHNMLRADAFRWDASLRAHEKENSLAPALVSQEEATAGSRAQDSVGAGCRGSST
jgi:hypothetical protein